jgi:hypothetical protein
MYLGTTCPTSEVLTKGPETRDLRPDRLLLADAMRIVEYASSLWEGPEVDYDVVRWLVVCKDVNPDEYFAALS